jgi:protein SCO1/2
MFKHLFFVLSLGLLVCCQKRPSVLLSAPTGGDFSIASTKGNFKTTDYRGKTIFLFFGFTQCPHICPTTLGRLNRFVKILPEAQRQNVEVIFVSVDVKRDSLETLKKRLTGFPVNFQGAIDTEPNLKKLLAQFGGFYRVIQGKDPSDIIIDHTALIFMINKKGEWVNSFKHDTSPEDLLAAYQSVGSMPSVYSQHQPNQSVEVMAENVNCNLAQTPCQLEGVEVSIGPYPITSEKSFKVNVSTKSSLAIPLEIDFQGIESNMGYIRPRLSKTSDNTYSGEFYIPFCDESQMRWKAALILQTKEGPKSLVFHFNSVLPIH